MKLKKITAFVMAVLLMAGSFSMHTKASGQDVILTEAAAETVVDMAAETETAAEKRIDGVRKEDQAEETGTDPEIETGTGSEWDRTDAAETDESDADRTEPEETGYETGVETEENECSEKNTPEPVTKEEPETLLGQEIQETEETSCEVKEEDGFESGDLYESLPVVPDDNSVLLEQIYEELMELVAEGFITEEAAMEEFDFYLGRYGGISLLAADAPAEGKAHYHDYTVGAEWGDDDELWLREGDSNALFDLTHLGIISVNVTKKGDQDLTKGYHQAYCVEKHQPINNGDGYESAGSNQTSLTAQQRNLISLTLIMGQKDFTSGYPASKASLKEMAGYTATQMLVWLIEHKAYTFDDTLAVPFKLTTKGTAMIKAVVDADTNKYGNKIYSAIRKSGVNNYTTYVKPILDRINAYYVDKRQPDPAYLLQSKARANAAELGYDIASKKWVATFTDATKNLDSFDWTLPEGVSGKVNVTASKVTVTLNARPSSAVLLTGERKEAYDLGASLLQWQNVTKGADGQVVAVSVPQVSPVTYYMAVSAETTSIGIRKIWDDDHNAMGKRPASLSFEIGIREGTSGAFTAYRTVKLSASDAVAGNGDEWLKSISDLPRTGSSGKKLYYKISEVAVADYTASGAVTKADAEGNYVFTNKWVPSAYGSLQLIKASTCPDMTGDHPLYALEGAQYAVYTDAACTLPYTPVGAATPAVFVTDVNGETLRIGNFETGTYYVKEIKAPDGFKQDENVYTVDIDVADPEKKSITLNVKDEPVNDPMGILIRKEDADGKDILSLAGTEFTICYYPSLQITRADLETVSPARTWIIKTLAIKDDQGKTAYSAALYDDNLMEGSDDFYRDAVTGKPVLPLGTITIAETKAAPGYLLKGKVYDAQNQLLSGDVTKPLLFRIEGQGKISGEDGGLYDHVEVRMTNEMRKAKIRVLKKGESGKVLQGVAFSLSRTDDGMQKMAGVTDSKGELSFEDLVPGTYCLTENAALDGYALLKEPVTFDLPYTVTKAEGDAMKLDPDFCEYDADSDTYLVYQMTVTVTDTADFKLPMTGGVMNLPTVLSLFGGLALYLAAGLYLIKVKPYKIRR